jgi:hypothetical protein
MAEHARAKLLFWPLSDGRMRARGLATMSLANGTDGAELLCAMLRLDPARRFTASKALEHRWFASATLVKPEE